MRESLEIMLGGVPYQLRPTWAAYAEIESRTGKSIRQLWVGIASGEVKLSELAAIVVAGMKAASDGSQNIGEQKVMQAVYEAGTWWDQEGGIAIRIAEYLEILGWTPEQREKIKAEIDKMNQRAVPSAESSPSAPPSTA